MIIKFSVLMSVYYKEKPEYFNRAMQSIWSDQTFRPDEIVLVKDGPLTEELDMAIDYWKNIVNEKIKIIALSKNVGSGASKNIGIKECSCNYIAVADSDDVCSSNRFEKQLSYLKRNPEVDVLGGQIEEFENNVGDMSSMRVVPTEHDKIVRFSKKRYAFNHPTTMYRKSTLLSIGGYRNDYLYEDYALSVRILCNGGIVANLPDTLVYMRVSPNLFKRRGGWKYAISEIKVQYEFYQLGFISILEFMVNLAIRVPVRLMPNQLRRFIYKYLLRRK